MTTSFDLNLINKSVNSSINRYSKAINKRVKVNIFNLLRILSENIQLNANQITVHQHGSSWWSPQRCDIAFTFKLHGSEITIVASHRNYYEFRFRKYNPAVINVFQYLTFEEDKLIATFKKYFDQYRLTTAHYIHKMCNYALFKDNVSLYKMFDEICSTLEQYTEVIGFKDHRYNVSEYIDSSFRSEYNGYKYNVAFKKNNKLVFILVNASKIAPLSLSSMLLKLDSDKVFLENKKDNINYQDIQMLLDYLNN